MKPGLYTIKCSFVGYESKTFAEINVNPNKPTILNINLIESSTSLDVVEITASPFQKSEESPVSKRSISATEIYRNPGGNRDISKVIQSLPGVASTVSFRNDIIIRGGGVSGLYNYMKLIKHDSNLKIKLFERNAFFTLYMTDLELLVKNWR
mgnify:CR=1 FL=1